MAELITIIYASALLGGANAYMFYTLFFYVFFFVRHAIVHKYETTALGNG